MSLATLNQFINHTFKSNGSGAGADLKIENDLKTTITAQRMDQVGAVADTVDVSAGKTQTMKSVKKGDQLVILDKHTNSWVRSVTVDGEFGKEVKVKSSGLLALGDTLFDIPPLVDKVPGGPTFVLVGQGVVKKRPINQSLFWRRVEDVLVPANAAFVDESISETTGTTLTKTEQKSLSATLGVSFTSEVDVFLASLSQTISASITTESSFARSLAVTNSTTQTVTTRFKGISGKDAVVFRFQLIEVLSVFDEDGKTVEKTVENALPRFQSLTVAQ